MKRLIAKIAPAFDEILVYPCTVLGILIAPVVAAASVGERPGRIVVHWWDWAIALFLAVAVLMAYEMFGSAEGKKKTGARWRRYGFAFLLGAVWRQAVPAIVAWLTGSFRGTP